MRILHVLQQLPMKTGSGVYYTNLIEELDKHGHENIMLYANQNEFDFPKSDLRFEVEFKSDRLPFPIMGMSDVMPYDSTVFSEATDEMFDKVLDAYREKLIYIKENLKPDMIISHHLFLVTNLVKEVFADQKVYAFCHGTDLRQIGQHEKFKKMLPNIPKLERIFTVAPGEDAKISAIFDIPKEKITLIGGGFNQNIFNTNYKAEPRDFIKIMYAGKISESKGVFALAGALPYIEEAHPDVELHLVGHASEEQRKVLFVNAKNSDKLFVYNSQTQETMAEKLKNSDIFVLPSYYEALGLIAIEALACGKLAVTSDIAGLKNQLGDKVNKSGVILYTELPRIYDLDKPVEEDVPAYEKRLAANIIKQIEKIKAGYKIPADIQEEIDKNSWEKLAMRVLEYLK